MIRSIITRRQISPLSITSPFCATTHFEGLKNFSVRKYQTIHKNTKATENKHGSTSDFIKVLEIPVDKIDVCERSSELKRYPETVVYTSVNHRWKSSRGYPTNSNNNNNEGVQNSFWLKTQSEKMHGRILVHFLPSGYPLSVGEGYTQFVSYCFLSSICGSAAMVLSTQTLLLAVGIGNASAAPMAGALNWVMKDGIGQLGGVIFASRITSNTSGNTIDKDPKRYRMISALSMDGATFLEILSPLFPGNFLLIASVANIGKNIGFLTASASRAALHQSLAIRDNLGDVTAKAGSQSIAASLLGTGLGIGISSFIGGDHMNVALGFLCLSSIHQFCTYKSLKAISLKKFNKQRLLIALDLYLQSIIDPYKNDEGFSPEIVAKHEVFFPFVNQDKSHEWLQVGRPLEEVAKTPGFFNLIKDCLDHREKYILSCSFIQANSTPSALKHVMLVFHHDATDIDIIRGMFHAFVLHSLSKNYDMPNDCDDDKMTCHLISKSYQFMNEHFESFISEVHKSWEMKGGSVYVESGTSRRVKIERSTRNV